MNELDEGFWVFGYGSLMWTPEFEFEECVTATVTGFSRSFCMWSLHHRGTPETPGLVLALDACEGASCTGLAFRVGKETAPQCLADLRERELVSSAYHEHVLPALLQGGQTIDALAYVIDPDHVQHTGHLSLEKQADVIAKARGGRGPNSEYLFKTSEHLAKIGLEDPELNELTRLVKKRLIS